MVDMTTFKERMKAGVAQGLAGGAVSESMRQLSSPTGGSSLVDDWWVEQLQAAGVPLRRSRAPLFILVFSIAIIVFVKLVPKPHH